LLGCLAVLRHHLHKLHLHLHELGHLLRHLELGLVGWGHLLLLRHALLMHSLLSILVHHVLGDASNRIKALALGLLALHVGATASHCSGSLLASNNTNKTTGMH
jgi:hypothetical protein